MNSKSVRLLALAGVISVAGCGDDVTGTGGLSEAEAQELAAAVLTAAITSAFQVPVDLSPVDGPALAPYSFESEWEGTGECPLGGTAGIDAVMSISGDDETQESSVDYTISLIHNACVVQSSTGNFTLSGNPSLVMTMNAESDGEGSSSYEGSLNGAIDWQHDGRNGTCPIAYSFSGSASVTGSGSYSVNGNVCGTSIQQEFNYGTT